MLDKAPAANGDQVRSLVAPGDHTGLHRRIACPESPWRLSSKPGAFPAEAFRVSPVTGTDPPTGHFDCHMSGPDHAATCDGTLLIQPSDPYGPVTRKARPCIGVR